MGTEVKEDQGTEAEETEMKYKIQSCLADQIGLVDRPFVTVGETSTKEGALEEIKSMMDLDSETLMKVYRVTEPYISSGEPLTMLVGTYVRCGGSTYKLRRFEPAYNEMVVSRLPVVTTDYTVAWDFSSGNIDEAWCHLRSPMRLTSICLALLGPDRMTDPLSNALVNSLRASGWEGKEEDLRDLRGLISSLQSERTVAEMRYDFRSILTGDLSLIGPGFDLFSYIYDDNAIQGRAQKNTLLLGLVSRLISSRIGDQGNGPNNFSSALKSSVPFSDILRAFFSNPWAGDGFMAIGA